MIEEAIAQLLITATALPATNVKPSTETVVTAATLPRLAYTRLRNPRGRRYTDQGALTLTQARFQLDAFAASMTAARTIAENVARPVTGGGLDGYAGQLQGTTIKRIYFPDDPQFAGAEVVDGKNQKAARYILDMIVEYRR